MKKYLLLLTLFCATFAMGTLLYNAAHQNTSIASISGESSVFSERTQVKQSAALESEESSNGLVDMGKELVKDASESVARFIFSLIYK